MKTPMKIFFDEETKQQLQEFAEIHGMPAWAAARFAVKAYLWYISKVQQEFLQNIPLPQDKEYRKPWKPNIVLSRWPDGFPIYKSKTTLPGTWYYPRNSQLFTNPNTRYTYHLKKHFLLTAGSTSVKHILDRVNSFPNKREGDKYKYIDIVLYTTEELDGDFAGCQAFYFVATDKEGNLFKVDTQKFTSIKVEDNAQMFIPLGERILPNQQS